MSIIDRGSVFIVGAGCSAPFGVPVGGSLIDDLAKQLTKEFKRAGGNNDNRYTDTIGRAISEASCFREQFRNYPIGLSLYNRAKNPDGFDKEGWQDDLNKLIKLEPLLNGQTSETIDDFIVENPDYADLAKIGIAWAIFDTLYSRASTSSGYVRKNVSARYLEGRDSKDKPIQIRNWIHLLINIVRHGLREQGGEIPTKHKVRIISFNYDPILEQVLEEQFQNTQSGYDDYSEYIEIVHPHGVFDRFPLETNDPAELISSWADKINVVNETPILDATKLARKNAEEWMIDSTNIYAAGFAFSKPNCDLLRLQKKHKHPTPHSTNQHYVTYCNYSGSAGLREIVKRRVGENRVDRRPYQTEQAGSPDSPLSIEEWIRGGFLGEMPG
ncbi:MAG: hypothetical protein ABJG15_17100 [Hyphomonadaceae bacterium]